MAECLCTPEPVERREKFREISCKCADVADKLIKEGELRPELRCDFIVHCFEKEYRGSGEEVERLYELAKERGWL